MTEFIPSLEGLINDYMARPDYQPLNRHGLIKALGLSPVQAVEIRGILRAMEARGRVVRLRGNRWSLPDAGRRAAGRLRVHPAGYGFVDVGNDRLYIAVEHLANALDGDDVEAERFTRATRGAKTGRRRPSTDGSPTAEGRILRVLHRRNQRLVGLLKHTPYYAYVIPDNPRILHNVRVRPHPSAIAADDGHKVLIDLDPWDPHAPALTGIVREDLGAGDEPGLDIRCLIRQYHLSEDFPREVLAEERRIAMPAGRTILDGRVDLREVLTLTIDPEDARDFDDAVSLVPDGHGGWSLGIHIADVAHFVKPGSAIDDEARRRGTTVYLVDRAITMLPPRLTAEICSLRPHLDRLTHSVVIALDAAGTVTGTKTFGSVIRSRARLHYDQVQALLDSGDANELDPGLRDTLHAMHGLAQTMRRTRRDNGALDFVLPEVRCFVDPVTGKIAEVRRRASNEAYQLIEEFMLAANRVVAEKIAAARYPGLYRIHPKPDVEQWEQMNGELAALGLPAGVATRDQINAMLHRIEDGPLAYAATLSVLRNLKRALYTSRPGEHFGLAFSDYTHFTSPIRRYPDLLVHRVLNALEKKASPPYPQKDVEAIALHCSETEADADEAEKESVELKRIEYYQQQLDEGIIGPHAATVVGLVGKGLLVEITETLQRGLVPFAALTDDHYIVHESRVMAVGRRRGRTFRIGDPMTVELVKVDRYRKWIDFRPWSDPARPDKPPSAGPRKKDRPAKAAAGKKHRSARPAVGRRGRRQRMR